MFVEYSGNCVLSTTVYSIVTPSFINGNPVNVCVQSSPVNVAVCTSSPFANNATSIKSGLSPSLSFSSTHTLFTVTDVSPGLCVFVIINPIVPSPLITFSYPAGTSVSSTVYSILAPSSITGNPVNVCDHFPSVNVTD